MIGVRYILCISIVIKIIFPKHFGIMCLCVSVFTNFFLLIYPHLIIYSLLLLIALRAFAPPSAILHGDVHSS